MALTHEQIAKLATLSRLRFTDEKLEAFASEFNDILSFVEQIQEADTEGVAPLTSVANQPSTPERPDEPCPPSNPQEHQANAPKAEMGFYVVPKIVE